MPLEHGARDLHGRDLNFFHARLDIVVEKDRVDLDLFGGELIHRAFQRVRVVHVRLRAVRYDDNALDDAVAEERRRIFERGNKIGFAAVHLCAFHAFAPRVRAVELIEKLVIFSEAHDAHAAVARQRLRQSRDIIVDLIEIAVGRIRNVRQHVHVGFGQRRHDVGPRRRKRKQKRHDDVHHARSDVMPVHVVAPYR